MEITIPKLSLVVLIGPSGSGKSTFARKHFLPTEVLSSDCLPGAGLRRRERPDGDQRRLRGAALHRRQAAGRGPPDGRRRHQRPARGPQAAGRSWPGSTTACRWPSCFNLPEKRLPGAEPRPGRPRLRAARHPAADVAAAPVPARPRSGRASGTSSSSTSPEEVEAAVIERAPLWNDKRDEHGPFDIIGDVHGCCDELEALLRQAGLRAVQLDER